MSDSSGDRAQQASPQRLQKMRSEGRVARSPLLVASLVLLAGASSLQLISDPADQQIRQSLTSGLQGQDWLSISSDQLVNRLTDQSWAVLGYLWPLMLVIVAFAVLGNLGQIGVIFVPQLLVPNPSRLSVSGGISRITSPTNLLSVLLSVFGVGILVAVGGWALGGELTTMWKLNERTVPFIADYVFELMVALTVILSFSSCMIAVVDFAMRRWRHLSDSRMTAQELRQELRESEGDPLTRRRRGQKYRSLFMTDAAPKVESLGSGTES